MDYSIFAVNPGSTSTKIALFTGEHCDYSENITHDAETLAAFPEISDQLEYRYGMIEKALLDNGIDLAKVDAYAGRGGGLVGLVGGTYEINDILLHHARIGFVAKHPSILGSQIAYAFAQKYGKRSFVVNPPDVDEFEKTARYTGFSDVFRESRIHALNQKEIGLRYAASQGKQYADMNLIIAHIGGGISVTAHKMGRMVDSTDCINGDGPMAPTRSGQIPAAALIKMCFSGKYSEKQMYNRVTKNGGLVDHLGTSDVREVVARISAGDKHAKTIYDAMIYQIAKSIGACSVALRGRTDAIILTGGISNDLYLVDSIREQAGFIAPVVAMPGEFEMEALAAGAIRVLSGQEQPLFYTGIPVWQPHKSK